MNKTNKFSPEVLEHAVRLVQEHRGGYASLWAAVESIAPKIGACQGYFFGGPAPIEDLKQVRP